MFFFEVSSSVAFQKCFSPKKFEDNTYERSLFELELCEPISQVLYIGFFKSLEV